MFSTRTVPQLPSFLNHLLGLQQHILHQNHPPKSSNQQPTLYLLNHEGTQKKDEGKKKINYRDKNVSNIQLVLAIKTKYSLR